MKRQAETQSGCESKVSESDQLWWLGAIVVCPSETCLFQVSAIHRFCGAIKEKPMRLAAVAHAWQVRILNAENLQSGGCR